MANYSWRRSHAQCPHYVGSWDRGITCGGRESNIRRKFRTARECADHYRQYCAQACATCPLKDFVERICPDGK